MRRKIAKDGCNYHYHFQGHNDANNLVQSQQSSTATGMFQFSGVTMQSNISGRDGGSEECNVLSCPYLVSREVYITMMTLYILVISTGICMNSLVCYLYVKGLVKQSACNLMLASLSVSDIGSGLFSLPYLFLDYDYLDVSETEGKAICGASQAGFIISVAVSIMTLAFISTSRFCLINFPLRFVWIHSRKSVKIFVLAAWTIAIGGLMPLFISFRHDKLTSICYREWPPHVHGELYSAMMFLLGFLLPIIIMFITFCCSARTLMKTPKGVREQSLAFKERRKIMILLGSLIFVFMIFWGPYFTFWVLSRITKIFPSTVTGEYERKRWVRVVILVALCNSVADPLVYVVTNREFRKGFKFICTKGRDRASTVSYPSSMTGIKVRNKKGVELLSLSNSPGSSPESPRAPTL